MKVLFVSSSSGSHGGGELFLVFLGRALSSIGVDVHFWLSDNQNMDALAASLEPIGPVIRQPYRNTYLRLGRSFSHLRCHSRKMEAIVSAWRSLAPDVIHVNKQCLEDGLDLLAAADSLPCAKVCTIHITQTAASLGAKLGGLRDWIAKRALTRFSGAIWAISQQRAEDLQRFLQRPTRIDYISNGVNIPEPTTGPAPLPASLLDFLGDGPRPSLLGIAVGRLEPQKDPMRFLRWAHAIRAHCPDFMGIWVGDGRMRPAFEQAIDEMKATEFIRCVGWVDDVASYLTTADIFLHPAAFEGLPFALLEAIAHRKACVITRELAGDLVEFPEHVWIIAEDSRDEWIHRVLNPAVRLQHSQNAFDVLEKNFSVQQMAQRYESFYQRILLP